MIQNFASCKGKGWGAWTMVEAVPTDDQKGASGDADGHDVGQINYKQQQSEFIFEGKGACTSAAACPARGSYNNGVDHSFREFLKDPDQKTWQGYMRVSELSRFNYCHTGEDDWQWTWGHTNHTYINCDGDRGAQSALPGDSAKITVVKVGTIRANISGTYSE
tara:strand:- start:728 stop:1216 length:489 start_codon:yes stop_codon:yes gene_type:complete